MRNWRPGCCGWGPHLAFYSFFLLLFTSSCSREAKEAALPGPKPALATVQATAQETMANDGVVAFLGDSLTAGLGLPEGEAYPAVLGQSLQNHGRHVRIINAGVSGDTTAGGLRRVDWLLAQKPDVLVVALGANDGLRGLPLDMTEKNLREIVKKGKTAGARVLLCGLLVPPNYPPALARKFEAIFSEIAVQEAVPLVPFLLEGVAGKPDLNLPDGIHPNTEGQRIVASNVLPYLEPLLKAKSTR